MTPKQGYWFAGLGLTVVLLASCNNGRDPAGEGSGSAQAQAQAQAPADITAIPAELTFYNSTAPSESEELFMAKYGNAIAKKFPNYKIKYHQNTGKGASLADLIASGQLNIDIDISAADITYNSLIQFGLQDDISDLIKKYKFDLNRLEPNAVEVQRKFANGGIYGIPFSVSTPILFYNKQIFDLFAQPYPKDGMTWDDVYSLAKALTRSQGGIQYRGFASSFVHVLRFNQSSAPLVDLKTNKSLITADKFKREFDNMLQMYRIPGNEVPDISLSTQVSLFEKERTAAMMVHITRYAPALWTKVQDFKDWDMAQMPQWKDMPGVGSQVSPYYFYQFKTSKSREAAFQVLMFIASDEFQQHIMRQGYMSSLKDPSHLMKYLAEGEPLAKTQNLKALLPAKYAPSADIYRYSNLVEKELTGAAIEVLKNGTDTNTALRTASDRADKAVADELAKQGK
ncbi:ABC transporter substrate-binding protein [Paenibacillus hemerocallicola]|uniref:ABC transporter substrate-binding protein n=1 Tax=Paenibacillus hemerocallicola TaxID=1172614 RepID=UPI00159EC772|nr:extracellular solute-binding protein [Paenibacillus hemerocallicola]